MCSMPEVYSEGFCALGGSANGSRSSISLLSVRCTSLVEALIFLPKPLLASSLEESGRAMGDGDVSGRRGSERLVQGM